MNAPNDTATCPTCGGLGKRVRAWDLMLLGGKRGKLVQRCVSCRGTGQVDPLRVCAACGNWVNVCKCAKSKIVKQWKVDEMNGVNWIEKDECWRVEFRRDGTTYYMGQYPDKTMAITCRMEAENTPTEQLPALRQKYANLKKARAKVVEPEPAETHDLGLTRDEFATTIAQLDQEAPADIDEDQIDTGLMAIHSWIITEERDPDMLYKMLTAARVAEKCYQDALAAEQRASQAAHDAKLEAIAAWNEVAKLLVESGMTVAFDESALGFLREEIARS